MGREPYEAAGLDTADVHVVMETSTILDGDAITPLVEELKDDVTGAGWMGVNPREDGHEWVDAEPGEVRGLLGHLFAVKRDAALAAGGFPADARYYRNADLEFSLKLPGTLVALGEGSPRPPGTAPRLPRRRSRLPGQGVPPDLRPRAGAAPRPISWSRVWAGCGEAHD